MSTQAKGDSSPESAKSHPPPDISKMPEPIPDTPENIARALLNTPPQDDSDWDFMKGRTLEEL